MYSHTIVQYMYFAQTNKTYTQGCAVLVPKQNLQNGLCCLCVVIRVFQLCILHCKNDCNTCIENMYPIKFIRD